jgi:hypothetical protein
LQRSKDNDKWLISAISGDESWRFFSMNLEQSNTACNGNLPRLASFKKARMSKSKVKAMLTCFFDCKEIQLQEFVCPGHTVNNKFNLQVLEHVIERVHLMRPELFPDKWILRHDNAPSQTVLCFKEISAKESVVLPEQPIQSPELTPCDFFFSVS